MANKGGTTFPTSVGMVVAGGEFALHDLKTWGATGFASALR